MKLYFSNEKYIFWNQNVISSNFENTKWKSAFSKCTKSALNIIVYIKYRFEGGELKKRVCRKILQVGAARFSYANVEMPTFFIVQCILR